MRQRDPHWLARIVDEAVRDGARKPPWLRSAEVEAKLSSMAARTQTEDAATSKRKEPAE
jgi:hypothetical protein